MNPKVIHNEKDYEQALVRIESLMEAKPGTPTCDELDLWATLVSVYEDQHYAIGLPEPIEAVKFRMEQQGLRQGDLIPYIGSASKVSEVLSGKRPLSLSMIRRLHQGLEIPAEVLLQECGGKLPQDSDIDWQSFPLAEMIKRGWITFDGTLQQAKERARELIQKYMEPFNPDLVLPALMRQHVRKGKNMDRYALFAWRIRVMHLAQEQSVSDYQPGLACQDFIRKIIQLSIFREGPRLAREYLSQYGIHLVTEDHLPKTYLDGAAMLMPDGRPLLALTLRHDRLDNFWFTLAHELAHVALHLEAEEDQSFFDDLDVNDTSSVEKEADHLATESLIPGDLWRAACLSEDPTPASIKAFARRLNIGPCIPAGRIRHETGNFKLLTRLVGLRQVRKDLALDGTPAQ
ncbi:MAG: ImmA/IrrE family metallo-endopeptidase [Planctomycetes bacterium]|nr:ImmA/IrrE family metallo-endopeptidase [Planctomycetota bacterium]